MRETRAMIECCAVRRGFISNAIINIKEKLEEVKLYLEVQKLSRLIQKGCIEHLHCSISIVHAFKLADQPI